MVRARSVHWAVAITAGFLLVLSTQPTQADWLPAFTGYTNFGSIAKTDATSATEAVVNFGVYQNPGGVWTDDFGSKVQNSIVSLGSKSTSKSSTSSLSEAAKTARFVYFYEVVNTEGKNKSLDCIFRDLKIPVPASSVSGTGFLSKMVFNENGTPVDNKNPTLGPSVGNTPDVPGDGKPSFSGFVFTGAPFTKSLKAENPLAALTNEEVKFVWKDLDEKDFSSVVFFTSNLSPEYCASILSGKTHGEHCFCSFCRKCRAEGDIPCPVPEPTPLVLLITGVMAAGVVGIRGMNRRSK